ncbi:MAG TPA: radical SAM protein [Candidatus Polarisedimenticolia bacterium]|nr:radical SAM protein [Candidatus Polarisedimenticolia bacterium]
MNLARAHRPDRVLTVVLIKPSRYDDDGYVVRHWRGVLPSNTLAAFYSLTEDVVARGGLGPGVAVRLAAYDETVDRVSAGAIARRHGARRPGDLTLICLVGVQTNQFPRAADLALEFRRRGLPVMIGGFHVSGILELFHDPTPEIAELMAAGVTVVSGEVEEAWGGLLGDALAGRLKVRYDVCDRPDLTKAPLPRIPERSMRRFAYPQMATVDVGRGCPFNCSFCSIINVQGKTMRHRDPDRIEAEVRHNWKTGIDYYFFTDDNFSRNPCWEAIFDRLIRLREEEGIAIDFMIQVDTLAWKTPRFIEKAARAGSSQVFIGLETIRQANLKAAGKTQNKTAEYRAMFDAWHEAGIACHVGYILGFPEDTPETIAQDVRDLREVFKVDQASFFMLTPIPGSRDHLEMVRKGIPLDADPGNYDSFHPTMRHPLMTGQQWLAAYRRAWRDFYSFEGMREALLRANHRTYWGMFKNYIWYKVAMIEDAHPMITGFVRLKDRKERRRGRAVEGRLAHLKRRLPEIVAQIRAYVRLFLEMEELWLQTRHVAPPTLLSRLKLPTRPTWIAWPSFAPSTRRYLSEHWGAVRRALRDGRLWALRPLRSACFLASDFLCSAVFGLALIAGRAK